MKISVASDERVGIATPLIFSLQKRGHEVEPRGALVGGESSEWAFCSEETARDVAEGRAEQGVVCCWTGTGASMAANKIPGARAALCLDAQTANGARIWNDANVLVLSLRSTSEPEMEEILDAWFNAKPSEEESHQKNIKYLSELDGAQG